jgi:hypothetical protein
MCCRCGLGYGGWNMLEGVRSPDNGRVTDVLSVVWQVEWR